jgi:hypothetical protein
VASDSPPLCSVIIVNFNGRHLLDACLDAVLSQSGPSFEVILVDNGSTDGSAGHVRNHYPKVRIVDAGSNLGFSGGTNLGVEIARGGLIVLLNNDTIVEPGWIAGLVAAAAPADVAIVSSLVLTVGIPARYYERNGSINFLCHNIMRVFGRLENIFYGGGASLLYKKELLGVPFDNEYFVYCEDVYLGLRARFMGYRVLHSNASVVRHIGSATSGKQKTAVITFLQERNRMLTVLTFFSRWTIIRILPFLLINSVSKTALALVSRRYSFPGLVRAYWWFLVHPRELREKRALLARERFVHEREVISWMTGKLTNGESFPGKLLNGLALLWCRLVRLKTVDFLRARDR